MTGPEQDEYLAGLDAQEAIAMSLYYIEGVLYRFEPPDKLVATETRIPCPNCDSQAGFDSRFCGFLCLGQCRWSQAVARYTRAEFELLQRYSANELRLISENDGLNDLISAMARTLEDCRTRIVGYDFDTAALQARIGELLARAEKCK